MRFEAGFWSSTYEKVASDVEVDAVANEKLLTDLLFEATCYECHKMSVIPQGAFAALQVHKNFNRSYGSKQHEEEDNTGTGFETKNLQEGREPTPLKYNSKLMNSIWGLYNRYSVHNFKKIDANEARILGLGASVAEGPAASCIIGTNPNGAAH